MFFKRREKFKQSGPVDWIVACLGNPGKQYVGTRHNAGFFVAEKLSKLFGTELKKIKFKSYVGYANIGEYKVLLLTPQTFMNLSGEAVLQAMNFYKIPPEKTLIIFDDVSLDVGTIRIRRKGSDGGQKGIRDIIHRANSEDFPRIKIGIGAKPHADYDMSAWVLSKFSDKEKKELTLAAEKACDATKLIVNGSLDEAMNKYSR